MVRWPADHTLGEDVGESVVAARAIQHTRLLPLHRQQRDPVERLIQFDWNVALVHRGEPAIAEKIHQAGSGHPDASVVLDGRPQITEFLLLRIFRLVFLDVPPLASQATSRF